MKLLRLCVYTLIVLVALVAAVAFVYRGSLLASLEQQARQNLQQYGVQDFQLGPLRWTRDGFSTDYLRLSGSIDGYSFEISAHALKASYEWRELWRGNIDSLALSQLAVSLEELAVDPGGTTEPLVLSEVSPHALRSRLPLQRITVGQWRVAYKPLQGAEVKAEGDLGWEQSLELGFAAVLPWARVSGELRTPDRESMTMALQLSHQDMKLGNMQVALQRSAHGGWQWDVEGDIAFAPLPRLLQTLRQDYGMPLDAVPAENFQLAGEAGFKLTLAHPDSLLLPATATGDFLAQFTGDINVSAAVAELAVGDLVRAASGHATASANLADGTLAVTLGPTAWQAELAMAALGLSEEARNGLQWGDTVPLSWRSSGDASLRIEKTGAMALHLVENQLLLGDQRSALRWHGLQLQARVEESTPDDLLVSPLTLALKARLDTRLRNRDFPQLRLSLAQQGSLSQSAFSLALLDTAESLQLDLAGELNPQTGVGEYNAQLRSRDLAHTASVVVPLLQKFDLLQQVVVIDGGSFSLDSQLRSSEFSLAGLRQQSVLNLADVSGSYGEYQFGGLDISAAWQGVQRWQTLEPVELALARLDVGFEVSAIRALLSLPQATAPASPVVSVDTFEAGMFGGRVYLPAPRRWDFASASNSFTLRAEDWSLADMVALQPGQDIHAQGVLEGELPMTLADGRIIIDKGYLRARAPGGNIRYMASAASQALSAGSSELALAMSLLEDFRYRTLSSEVELDPQGNLLLGLALEGSNPDYYEGRSIRFNINLEQNLDPLLQSLRLSDSLVEQVEKGLR